MAWWKKILLYIVPTSPYDSLKAENRKIGFFVFKPMNEHKGVANLIVFCLAVFSCSITCICNSDFLPNDVIPTFRGRKRLKSEVKCGHNYRKFKNLLEVLKWHKNNSVGQFRCENEIHELFSLLTPFSPVMEIEIFIVIYRQMAPQSTRNRI